MSYLLSKFEASLSYMQLQASLGYAARTGLKIKQLLLFPPLD